MIYLCNPRLTKQSIPRGMFYFRKMKVTTILLLLSNLCFGQLSKEECLMCHAISGDTVAFHNKTDLIKLKIHNYSIESKSSAIKLDLMKDECFIFSLPPENIPMQKFIFSLEFKYTGPPEKPDKTPQKSK